MKPITKTETVEEFLNRGGKITKIEPILVKEEKHNVPWKAPSIADAMTLAEGQFYFAQKSKRKSKGAKGDDEEEG